MLVIITGDELLEGYVRDMNLYIIANYLREHGRRSPRKAIFLKDDPKELLETIRNSKEKVILITGGIGPTEDDRTITALKELPGIPRRFRNPVGTADALYLNYDGKHVFALPGIPKEVEAFLYASSLGSFLLKVYQESSQTVRLIKTCIFNEKHAQELLSGFEGIGYMITTKGVFLRVPEEIVHKVLSLLDRDVWGMDEQDMESTIASMLKERSLTVSTAESCTSGRIADVLTSISGSSEYYKGSVIAYSLEAKRKLLGVKEETLKSFGVYSRHTALEMARGVRKLLGTDIGISSTGMAEVEHGKPFAYFGISLRGREYVVKQEFVGERNYVRESMAYFIICKLIKLLEDA